MKKRVITIAIQNNGRLTKGSLEFLRRSGIDFEVSKRRLFTICRNIPIKILYIRNADISRYIETGTVDLGIIGQNTLFEERPNVKKLLNLRFGFCSLVVAVPRNSDIKRINQLEGKTIATAFPNSLKQFLKKKNMSTSILCLSGSVELTPALGIANAVADLVSTGSTLVINDLRTICTIAKSEAVLIANPKFVQNRKSSLVFEKLIRRFKSILSAEGIKSVNMIIPKTSWPRIKKILLNSISINAIPVTENDKLLVKAVVNEDVLWQNIDQLNKLGIQNITVLPINQFIH